MDERAKKQALLDKIDQKLGRKGTMSIKSEKQKRIEQMVKELVEETDSKEEFSKTRDTIRIYFSEFLKKLGTLDGLVKAIKETKIVIPDKVTVSNLKDIPKPVFKLPEAVNIRQAFWMKDFVTDIKGSIKDVADAVRGNSFPKKAKDAIPVKLSDGKEFYKAIADVTVQGGTVGGGGGVPTIKTSVDGIRGVAVVNPDGTNLTVGGGGGTNTEYDEGDIAATITGIASLAEGPSNTLTPLQVDASKNLQVDIAADSVGIGGGTQYTEDAVAVADPVGNAQILVRDDTPVSVAADGDNVARRGTAYGAAYTQIVNSSGSFVDSFGGGTQYAEDTAHNTGDTGTMSLAVRNDSLTSLVGTDGDYSPLQVNRRGALYTHISEFQQGLIDSFGHMVVGNVNNQVDIQFYRGDGSVGDIVTETNANGGTATATGGMATFAATTTANSQAKGVTNESTTYVGGTEMYTIFTAAFTGAGGGTSYQRIGLYNDNNGFFVGYEGGTFGITVRKGGSDSQTAKASFSVDDLTGGAASEFTRSGSPEAIDLTKLNVWRIRYGWVGSAPISFEVLAPDGNWVLFHKILQPNNAALPSIENSDLPVTCDVNSGNSSAALSILTNCWVAGTTDDQIQMDSTVTDKSYGELTRSVIVAQNPGGTYGNIQRTTGGNLKVSVQEISDGLDVGAGNAGTETARVSISTDDVNLSAIKTAVELIDNGMNNGTGLPSHGMGIVGSDGSNGQLIKVDNAGELQVDLASAIPAGTNAIGKLAANSGVDIGDVDVTSITGLTMSNAAAQITGDEAHDAADAGNPVKIGGRAQTSEAQPEEVADNDRVDALFDRNGYLRVRGDFDPSFADINDSTSGDNTIIAAAGAGKRIAVWSVMVVSDGTVDVRFEDGAAGTAFTGQIPLQAREGFTYSAGGLVPLWVGSANTLLNLELSAAINVHGSVSYTVIDD